MTIIERQPETELRVRIEAIGVGLREMAVALHGMVRTATRSLVDPASDGYDVLTESDDIERYSVELQRELISAIACEDASPSDLRFLISTFQVVRHLDQISGLAVNVAHLAEALHDLPATPRTARRVLEIGTGAIDMVDTSVEAFSCGDASLARRLVRAADAVADLTSSLLGDVIHHVTEPLHFEAALVLHQIACQFERIAEHAVAIAEETPPVRADKRA